MRHATTHSRYETCSEDNPNCCGNAGCCDNRGWKLFVVISVGIFSCCLFFGVFSVFLYSAFFHRKQHTGEEPVKAKGTVVAPRYSMDTYLTVAGYGLDALPKQGPPRSAIQPLEHHAPDSSSTEESEEEESSEEEEKDEAV
ncbi:hypothetical protein ACOMHN_016970 [Nucella lapillus]